MGMCTIFGTKIAHLSWTKNFWYKSLLLLSSTYWPFSLCKIKINSYSGSRIMTMHHFWAQNGPFAPTIFLENYYYHSHLPIGSFHCAIFKKILPADPELWGCAIFGSKMAHFPKWEFFQKACSWALLLLFRPIYTPKNKVRY